MRTNAEQYAHDAWRCIEVVAKSAAPVMEPSLLQSCKGFALLTTKKTSLFGSVEAGHGVVIECIDVDEFGRRVYSAPVPVETTRMGIGFGLGYEKLYSVLLLKVHEAVKHMANGGGLEGMDSEVPHVSKDSTHKHHRTVVLDIDLMPGENEAQVFSASKGIMLADLSFSGGSIGPNMKVLTEWYGQDIKPNDVLLSKKYTPPAAFAKLYDFLNGMEGEGVPNLSPYGSVSYPPVMGSTASI